MLLEVGIMPDRIQGTYVQWSSRRTRWAVLASNRFLSEASFHTGDTPSWTQGDVIGEGVHAATGERMVLCNLGGYDTECHLNIENVRVADGPTVRAYGSEGGHRYGWWKRKPNFSPAPCSEICVWWGSIRRECRWDTGSNCKCSGEWERFRPYGARL